jgi:hypothetical protein
LIGSSPFIFHYTGRVECTSFGGLYLETKRKPKINANCHHRRDGCTKRNWIGNAPGRDNKRDNTLYVNVIAALIRLYISTIILSGTLESDPNQEDGTTRRTIWSRSSKSRRPCSRIVQTRVQLTKIAKSSSRSLICNNAVLYLVEYVVAPITYQNVIVLSIYCYFLTSHFPFLSTKQKYYIILVRVF